MKIDKKNLRHWIYLLQFGVNVMCAIAWRPFRRRRTVKQVVLYGHKFTGNLRAIYQYVRESGQGEFEVTFLTLDPGYYPDLVKQGVSTVLATTSRCARLLSLADAVITDHGLHAMSPLLSLSNVKFFDVWHGFGFKGHNPDDFRIHRRYDEIWVASPLQARFYIEGFGFDADKVKPTGYARQDRLILQNHDVQAIKSRLGLGQAQTGKIVLFAPTWKQDADERSMYPFGLTAEAFLVALSTLAQHTGSTFVIRAHLNTAMSPVEYPRVCWIPFADFPDTEAMLLVSDVLLCDWSSIAFDWLALDRPTVFLDVPPPFAGHTLDASHRFGEIVDNMDALQTALRLCLENPTAYHARHADHTAEIREAVFGSCMDGMAAARCFTRLRTQLGV